MYNTLKIVLNWFQNGIIQGLPNDLELYLYIMMLFLAALAIKRILF